MPVLAAEIEFYLISDVLPNPAQVLEDMAASFHAGQLDYVKVEQERGPGQFEVALKPAAEAVQAVAHLARAKHILQQMALRQDKVADFSARPFADQPGSGLHIHVHLEDTAGRNMFFRSREDDAFSETLLHAIGGLLVTMKQAMPIFAPAKTSLARFAPGSHAPTTVSWGTNNRTVAIRLPTKPYESKHLEHRVAGADADPAAVMAAILGGIYYGLRNKIHPGEPIYGDASLEMYQREKLVTGLAEPWPSMSDMYHVVEGWLN